jgi:hypothetical protein
MRYTWFVGSNRFESAQSSIASLMQCLNQRIEIKKNKTKQNQNRLLVSSVTYRKLRSYHSILTISKKLKTLKDQ